MRRIIATGSRINPDETAGLRNGAWYKNIFDFYTVEGAMGLANFTRLFSGSIISIADMIRFALRGK